jgi:signal peptidase I
VPDPLKPPRIPHVFETPARPAAARDATSARPHLDWSLDGRSGERRNDGSAGLADQVDQQEEHRPDHAVASPKPPSSQSRRAARSILEWVVVIGGALLVALVVRSTLAQAFWIPSPSMEPTLQKGDRVLVNKVSYRLHDVNRGDIIVFERPESAVGAHPESEIKDLIKRVIGLPGDTIESRADGAVYINDRKLTEPYLPAGTRTTGLELQEIPEGHVFVMGDNRANSADSREFGPVDEDLIIGRAFLRIYPLGDIGGL